MKLKFLMAALALSVSPSLALAACFGDHAKEEIVMSCTDGTVYDADTQACVPETTS